MAGAGLALVGVSMGACVYDPGDRCDVNQELVGGRYCVCVAGMVLINGKCTPCGANASVVGSRCVCEDGQNWSEDEGCVDSAGAAGDACDVEGNPCEDPVFGECLVESGTTGYCTSTGCGSSSDCPAGFACVVEAEPSYCGRLPDGTGQACSSSEDCAGLTADYCEEVFARACLVAGCDQDADCTGDWICCDASSILGVTLCVPQGECLLP